MEEYGDNDEYVVTAKPKSSSKSRKIPRTTTTTTETETSESIITVTSSADKVKKSKKIRPPLSPGYRKAVGGVIREEDEEVENDVLPEYVKKSKQDGINVLCIFSKFVSD